jgi:hypothetical protein
MRIPLIRIALYCWAFFPATLLGLLVAVVTRLTGGRWARVDGVLEVYGGVAARLLRRGVPLLGPAEALTLGHVVLGRDQERLEASRAHERAHVRQYELWGPLFLPAYFTGSLWARLRGKDFYRDNPFEVRARAAERDAGFTLKSP